MNTDSPLMQSARAVATARTELDRIDGRLTDLRERSRDLDELKAALTAARERRAQILADAMIAGRKANLDKADKEVATAQQALLRREDECTAVDRALATLQAQREVAEAALSQREAAFREHREEHVRSITNARYLALKFHEAITAAQARMADMPAHFREQLTNANLLTPDQAPPAEAVQELVARKAEAELAEAETLAGILPPPVPQCLGWVDEAGNVHPLKDEPIEEPPVPTETTEPVRIGLADRSAPGIRWNVPGAA